MVFSSVQYYIIADKQGELRQTHSQLRLWCARALHPAEL